MSKTLEDMPEAEIGRMMDYLRAAGDLTRGKHDFRIPYIVAEEAAKHGFCVLSMNGLAKQFRSTRRTMCSAIQRLVEANAIREIGRTDQGRAMYVPCLELGESHRSAREAQVGGR